MSGRSFQSDFKLALAAGVVLFAARPLWAAITFTGLGDLPGGGFNSVANGVSADGAVVVGRSDSAAGREAFRWTAAGGIVGLGDLPGGTFDSEATGVTAGGSVIVGEGRSASGVEAFRWTEAGGMTGLGDLPGGAFSSRANGVSADGSVIVGSGNGASGIEAFRWTEATGMTGLGDLPGGFFQSVARAVSADGSVIVGQGNTTSFVNEAFRWSPTQGMIGLGSLPGGDVGSVANGVTAVPPFGAFVVGSSPSASGQEAFRHGVFTGMIGLGDLPGGAFVSEATGVTPDGGLVVGRSVSASGVEAFVWDAASGMRSLRDVLTGEVGLDLTDWTLTNANAITPDGRTIVGFGANPDGDEEAWRVQFDAEWISSTSGAWDDISNWPLDLVPRAGDHTFITPETGLSVDGPAAPATVRTLTLGTQTSGFAQFNLRPGGTLTATEGATIQAGGRLSGNGQLGGPVAIEPGGEIAALTGDALNFDSPVANDGEVNVINGTLTFPGDGDPNGDPNDGLTNNTTLNLINAEINGDVHSPTGSTINVGAGVVFNGLASGGGNFPGAGIVTFNGGYDPGDSPAVVQFNGGVALGSGNRLTMELAGTDLGQFDRLEILGDAALDGELLVSLLDGFTPSLGQQWEILDVGGTLTGTFAGLDERRTFAATGGEFFRISYAGGDGNNVVLTAVAGIPGDYNNNGVVDAADYTVWRDTLGSTTSLAADGDGDNMIDAGDYDVWKQNFSSMGGSRSRIAAAVMSAVPEPSTLWLLLCSMLVARFKSPRLVGSQN